VIGSLIHDSQLWVRLPATTLPRYFWDRWPSLMGKLSWHITTNQVNSALHPSWIAKLSALARVMVGSHSCQVTGNTVWSHMACDFQWQCSTAGGDLWLRTAISALFTYLVSFPAAAADDDDDNGKEINRHMHAHCLMVKFQVNPNQLIVPLTLSKSN